MGQVPVIYQSLPKAEWASVADRHDPRVGGRDGKAFLVRSYALGLAYRLTRWKRHGVYRACLDTLGLEPPE